MNNIISLDEGGTSAFSAEDLKACLDPGCMPDAVQERLDRTYASLKRIPQQAPPKRRRVRRGLLAVSIAAACALVSGAAFAAATLIPMGTGDGAFFAGDKNLPVFDSMEPGAKALGAEVGQVATIDGVCVTLDSISCDRNVANLYLTLSKEGGFDMGALSVYEGSEESEWARLQSVMPILSYEVSGSDGARCSGSVGRLDAYLDGTDVKCLMRITPELTMPDQVQIDIEAYPSDLPGSVRAFSVGLDMASVPAPRELGAQELTFETTQGNKTLDVERFTASELATVMVARNQEEQWTDAAGVAASGWPEDRIHPRNIKVTDSAGNVLQPVEPGDGQGTSADDACVIEYAGLAADATSVTFTPILADEAAMEADRLERMRLMQAGQVPSADKVTVDVTQPGAKIATSPLGGYEVAGWIVADATVTIMLKPYGWTPGAPELIPASVVPMLAVESTDPETGQRHRALHSAIGYTKWDYATGELAQITSYYKATNAELEAVHAYECHVYPDGYYSEDATAAQTLALR